MMFIVQFGFTGISIKNGGITGNLQFPVSVWRLLILTVTIPRGPRTSEIFITNLRGSMRDSEWFVKHEAEILSEKERIYEEVEKGFSEEIDRLRSKNSQLCEEQLKANSELHTLKSAIKIVNTDKHFFTI